MFQQRDGPGVTGADLYRIAVGDETARGVPYAKAQLEDADWKVFLTAGS